MDDMNCITSTHQQPCLTIEFVLKHANYYDITGIYIDGGKYQSYNHCPTSKININLIHMRAIFHIEGLTTVGKEEQFVKTSCSFQIVGQDFTKKTLAIKYLWITGGEITLKYSANIIFNHMMFTNTSLESVSLDNNSKINIAISNVVFMQTEPSANNTKQGIQISGAYSLHLILSKISIQNSRIYLSVTHYFVVLAYINCSKTDVHPYTIIDIGEEVSFELNYRTLYRKIILYNVEAKSSSNVTISSPFISIKTKINHLIITNCLFKNTPVIKLGHTKTMIYRGVIFKILMSKSLFMRKNKHFQYSVIDIGLLKESLPLIVGSVFVINCTFENLSNDKSTSLHIGSDYPSGFDERKVKLYVQSCKFLNNFAHSFGGSIYISSAVIATIKNSLFVINDWVLAANHFSKLFDKSKGAFIQSFGPIILSNTELKLSIPEVANSIVLISVQFDSFKNNLISKLWTLSQKCPEWYKIDIRFSQKLKSSAINVQLVSMCKLCPFNMYSIHNEVIIMYSRYEVRRIAMFTKPAKILSSQDLCLK